MFFKDIPDSPLIRLYRTEYNSDYEMRRKHGTSITESEVRAILGCAPAPRKKFLGIF